MKNSLNNKRPSVPSMIEAYRRRQARAEQMLLIFWVGIMILVVGAGYLIYRFLNTQTQPEGSTSSVTPGPSEAPVGAAFPATPGLSIETQATAVKQTPVPSITPVVTIMVTYTVSEGETLAGIASQFQVDLFTLMAINPSVTPEFLKVGDSIEVPIQSTDLTPTPVPSGESGLIEYQVVAGDTLAGIAAWFGTTVEAIVQENNLENPDQLREGQTLRIPVGPGTSFPTTPSQPNPVPGVTPTQAS